MSHTAEPTTLIKLRLLKRLVVALVLLTGLLGAFCAYLLHNVSRDYSLLAEQSLTAMGELHRMTKTALSTQRAVLVALVGGSGESAEAMLARVGTALDASRQSREEIAASGVLAEARQLEADIERTGKVYEAAVGDFVRLLAEGRSEEANRLRHERARVALNDYLDAIEAAARHVEGTGVTTGREYADEARRKAMLVLGFASVPALFLGAIAATVAAVLAMMWMVMRRSGLDDGP